MSHSSAYPCLCQILLAHWPPVLSHLLLYGGLSPYLECFKTELGMVVLVTKPSLASCLLKT